MAAPQNILIVYLPIRTPFNKDSNIVICSFAKILANLTKRDNFKYFFLNFFFSFFLHFVCGLLIFFSLAFLDFISSVLHFRATSFQCKCFWLQFYRRQYFQPLPLKILGTRRRASGREAFCNPMQKCGENGLQKTSIMHWKFDNEN